MAGQLPPDLLAVIFRCVASSSVRTNADSSNDETGPENSSHFSFPERDLSRCAQTCRAWRRVLDVGVSNADGEDEAEGKGPSDPWSVALRSQWPLLMPPRSSDDGDGRGGGQDGADRKNSLSLLWQRVEMNKRGGVVDSEEEDYDSDDDEEELQDAAFVKLAREKSEHGVWFENASRNILRFLWTERASKDVGADDSLWVERLRVDAKDRREFLQVGRNMLNHSNGEGAVRLLQFRRGSLSSLPADDYDALLDKVTSGLRFFCTAFAFPNEARIGQGIDIVQEPRQHMAAVVHNSVYPSPPVDTAEATARITRTLQMLTGGEATENCLFLSTKSHHSWGPDFFEFENYVIICVRRSADVVAAIALADTD